MWYVFPVISCLKQLSFVVVHDQAEFLLLSSYSTGVTRCTPVRWSPQPPGHGCDACCGSYGCFSASTSGPLRRT